MLPARLKTRPNSLLKLSAMSLVVATLSGCGEDAKDCGGFWDKTFGRKECAVAIPQNTTAPIIQTPVISTISPSQPTVGEQTTFTLTGQHLTNDLQLALADCDNLQITSRTNSQIVFGCKPVVKGLHKVELKQNANVVADFSLEFQQAGEILRVKESKAEDVVQNSLGVDIVKGQLVVMVKDDVTPEQMAALAQKYKMQVVGQMDLVNMYQLEGGLTVDELEQTKILLEKEEGILNVDFNGFAKQQEYKLGDYFTPDDEKMVLGDDEWDNSVLSDDLYNSYELTDDRQDIRGLLDSEISIFGKVNPRNWHLRLGRVPYAWQRLKDMGAYDKFVPVGVVDSGFRLNHEDLDMVEARLSGVNGQYTPMRYPNDLKKDHGRHHGMHVAGIIGATVNNGKGIAGVSPNGTAIYGYRTDFSEMGTLAGIVWAANKGTKIINISIGKRVSKGNFDNRSINVASERASFGLFLAQLLKKKDILIVHSAGNDSNGCDGQPEFDACRNQVFPADIKGFAAALKSDLGSVESRNKLNGDLASLLSTTDLQGQSALDWVRNHTLVVGSLANDTPFNNQMVMSKFSNGGKLVDVFAPGGAIYSLSDESDASYTTMSGTSMAAPYVAGVAALALKANPTLSAMQLKWLMAWPQGREVMQHWICDYTQRSSCNTVESKADDAQKIAAGYIKISLPIINADKAVYDASTWAAVPAVVANGKFEAISILLQCAGNEAEHYKLNGATLEVYSVLDGQKAELIATSPTILNKSSTFLLPIDKRYVFRVKKGVESPVELDSRSFWVTKDKPTNYVLYAQDDRNNCAGRLTQDQQRYQLYVGDGDSNDIIAPQSAGESSPSITTIPASPVVNVEVSFSLVDTIFDGIKSVVWKFGQEIVEVFDNFGNAIKHIFDTIGEFTVSATLKDSTGKEVATTSTAISVKALVCPEGQIEQAGKCVDTPTGNTLFVDEFNDLELDTTKWTTKTATSCCGTGNPAVWIVSNGKLNVELVGGSDGYMGVGDGTVFTPNNISLSGDFDITLSAKELLRQTNGYKDNSGIALGVGKAGIGIYGNYSGYYSGHAYNTYDKHRVQAFDINGNLCLLDEGLSPSDYYQVDLRIRRVGGQGYVGYRLNGASAWSEKTCTVDNVAMPTMVVNSGDGGVTRRNGMFSVEVDRFEIRGVPTPAMASQLITLDAESIQALGGTLNGSVSFIEGRNGGKAAKLGGVAAPASIKIPNRDTLKFDNAATFDMWVRLDSMTGMDGYGRTVSNGTYAMSLVAKSHDRNGSAFMTTSTGGIWAATYNSTWSNGGACNIYIESPNIPLGTWFRVTYVVSSTEGIKYYVNQQLQSECKNARPSFAAMNAQDLYIGKFSDYWFPLNGAIQDVAVYKAALTTEQVQALK